MESRGTYPELVNGCSLEGIESDKSCKLLLRPIVSQRVAQDHDTYSRVSRRIFTPMAGSGEYQVGSHRS